MRKNADAGLQLFLPAGLALLVFGGLTLSTPLFTSLSPRAFWIDSFAGGLLVLIGLGGILKDVMRGQK